MVPLRTRIALPIRCPIGSCCSDDLPYKPRIHNAALVNYSGFGAQMCFKVITKTMCPVDISMFDKTGSSPLKVNTIIS